MLPCSAPTATGRDVAGGRLLIFDWIDFRCLGLAAKFVTSCAMHAVTVLFFMQSVCFDKVHGMEPEIIVLVAWPKEKTSVFLAKIPVTLLFVLGDTCRLRIFRCASSVGRLLSLCLKATATVPSGMWHLCSFYALVRIGSVLRGKQEHVRCR